MNDNWYGEASQCTTVLKIFSSVSVPRKHLGMIGQGRLMLF